VVQLATVVKLVGCSQRAQARGGRLALVVARVASDVGRSRSTSFRIDGAVSSRAVLGVLMRRLTGPQLCLHTHSAEGQARWDLQGQGRLGADGGEELSPRGAGSNCGGGAGERAGAEAWAIFPQNKATATTTAAAAGGSLQRRLPARPPTRGRPPDQR